MSESDWQTAPPPVGVSLELETAAGDMLTGTLSYISGHRNSAGQMRRQYMLKNGGSGIFEVTRWRRSQD